MPGHTRGDIPTLPTVFEAGSCRFTIAGKNEALLEQLRSLFVNCSGSSSSGPAIEIEIEGLDSFDQIGEAIRQIVVAVVAQHPKNLYVEGAALLNSRGELVLLVGTTRAGKSTLSAALTLGCGWKVLSEDLVLFDLTNKYILPLKLPISLRPGAIELIEEAVGSRPDIRGKSDIWMPMKFETTAMQLAHFDKVILLEAPNGKDIVLSDLIPEKCLRLMLPASNAIHFTEGADQLMEMVRKARCFRLTGGSLKQRIEAMNSV